MELRRIVEFLNEQMDPAEVLAIELRQFESNGLKTLVPTVYGLTQEASRKRATTTASHWDEATLFTKLAATVGPREVQVAREIYVWMRKDGKSDIIFGTGKENGSVYRVFRPQGVGINPAYLSSDGRLYLQIGSLERKPVFGPIEARRVLLQKIDAIEGAKLTEMSLTRYPGIALSTIAADPNGSSKVIAALDWMAEQIEKAG